MGSSVKASCPCGLDKDILIGGGMADFETTCFFPCLCKRCSDVVQVNLLRKEMRCLMCGSRKVIPYDDLSLSPKRVESQEEEKLIASWDSEELGRILVITDGAYKCPKCGSMTLRFTRGGVLWDES